MGYATVAQVREYLPQLGDDDEALLEDVLDRATDIIDGELGFSFAAYDEYAAASNRDVYSGAGGKWLYLPAHEADSVESVYLVSQRGTDDEETDELTEYVVETRSRLYLEEGWLPRRWYRVAAVWGYGPAPDAIVQVTLEVAVNLWQGRDAVSWSGSLGVDGGSSRPYQRSLNWAQKSIIQRVKSQYPREAA
ncbi:MAG: hypothetical protein PHQ60_15695 [Sideroxydans sp.]|nr:hypothetical protein [Sideroxydans sp.]